jgi:hypothetical protein
MRNFACSVEHPSLITFAVLPADMLTRSRLVVTMRMQPIIMAYGVHIRTAPFNSAGHHWHSCTDASFLMWSIRACHRKWIHSPITILQLFWGKILWKIILCVHIDWCNLGSFIGRFVLSLLWWWRGDCQLMSLLSTDVSTAQYVSTVYWCQ